MVASARPLKRARCRTFSGFTYRKLDGGGYGFELEVKVSRPALEFAYQRCRASGSNRPLGVKASPGLNEATFSRPRPLR